VNKNRETPVIIIVKKKMHGGGHHGGAWKVAFADFMTAMFALFLVMWIVNQSTDIRSAVAGYFQDPLGRADEFGSSIMPGEGAQTATVRPLTPTEVVEMRRNRLGALARHLEAQLDEVPELDAVRDKVEVQLTTDGLRIQLLEDSTGVFFDTGSSTPNPRGVQILALLGRELGSLPNAVRIEGYTDARPYSGNSAYTNWELSADRANGARRVLARNGMGADQVVQIRGLADHELRDPVHPYSASNRRITITMLMEYARPPDTRSPDGLPPDSMTSGPRSKTPGTST
jgi:chemotaxis protein MotB